MKKIVFSLAIMASFNMLSAQPGTLDATFGTGGTVVTSVVPEYDFGNAVAVQADGKIVVVGESGIAGNYAMSFVRYNADGTLDNTFSGDGRLIVNAGTSSSYASDVAILPDGKIVVTGRTFDGSTCDIVLVRLNADGTLDNTFAGDGIVLSDFAGASDVAESVILQADGKILVGGYCDDVFTVIRYNTDGSLDNTFGTTGVTQTLFSGDGGWVESLALQTDGKIVAGGFAIDGSQYKYAAARYNSDGTADLTFGGTGSIMQMVGAGHSFANGICIQPDGKILLGGHKWIDNSPLAYDLVVLRLNSDGTPDNTFGTSGVATAGVADEQNYAMDMALQSNGKIILAGQYIEDQASVYVEVACFTPAGLVDTSFGGDGIVITDVLTGDDYGYHVTIQPDGKILVSGSSFDSSYSDFLLIRYNAGSSGISAYSADELSLYPNPAKDLIYLNAGPGDRIDITDMAGRSICSKICDGAPTFDVSSFQPGVYVVTVYSGTIRRISKLMKN